MSMKPIILAVLSTSFVACGPDEPSPPNKPEIVASGTRAECRLISVSGGGMVSYLDRVSIRAQDLDGVDDLGNGLAVFGTTVLPLEKNTLEGDPVAGCGDADGRCVVDYVWERNRDAAQVVCGEDGNAFDVEFTITDEAGFRAEGVIRTTSVE